MPLALPEPSIQTVTLPATGTVRVTQFSAAWYPRNLAMWIGNAAQGMGGNGLGDTSYAFPKANYPDDVAQNVPNIFENPRVEDMFEWQPPLINGPPSPNPPSGLGAPVANLGHPFQSGFYAPGTGISLAGVSSQGTRVALQFTPTDPTSKIACASTVYLRPQLAPGTYGGVMVMTATDGNGAGPFMRLTGVTSSAPNLVVYEVLYAEPGYEEYVDIPCYNVGPKPTEAVLSVSLAPFYTSAAAGMATPTPANLTPTSVPRFKTVPEGIKITLPAHP